MTARSLPFQRGINPGSRTRIRQGGNIRARGGGITFVPGWEDLLAPQVLDEMLLLMNVAYKEATRLHKPDVDTGAVESSIGATLDRRDGSVYLYAGHWDARYTEYGTGPAGKATYGARGADKFPNAYEPEYGPGVPQDRGDNRPRSKIKGGYVPFRRGGLRARPFIRPAGVAAVRRVFGSG